MLRRTLAAFAQVSRQMLRAAQPLGAPLPANARARPEQLVAAVNAVLGDGALHTFWDVDRAGADD